MPVPCNEVFDYVDELNQDRLDTAVSFIDRHLNNVVFRNEQWSGTRAEPHYKLTLRGQLSVPDIAALKQQYEEAGWGNVAVRVIAADYIHNRAGHSMTHVTLYRHAQVTGPVCVDEAERERTEDAKKDGA